MDWNRVEKHELVGLGTIATADLRQLFQSEVGQERQLAVPVMNGGVAVEGNDRKKCQLNLMIKRMPSATPATQQARHPVALCETNPLFCRLCSFEHNYTELEVNLYHVLLNFFPGCACWSGDKL